MERLKYKKLLTELFSLMNGEKLTAALEEKKSAARVDAVQDLMREAVKKSSIGKFNGNPYFFGGRIYEEMTWDDFGNLVYDLMKRCNLPNGDYSRVEGVIKVCRRVVSGKMLTPNSAIVVFNNCVFDMDNKVSHPFNKKWVQTSSVPYDYNPREHIIQWRDFLDQVLPDKKMQKVLQEFLGSIFIDRTKAKIETMLVLRGSGSNGKSVVFETVMGLLGRDNVSNFGIGALISGSERKKNIAFINGKRLNYCSEIQALEFGKDSDALKSLISGEPTEARPIYGDNFTAYNIPLLMANANQMPYLKDWSYGMRRRICIIPFEVEIQKHQQRKSLARDLEHEYPAIFNWILEGRDRFINNGYKLTDSKELDKVMDEYQSESSTVMRFMFQMNYMCRYENIVDAEPKWVTSASLYQKYLKWCDDNHVETPENVTKFGRILSDAGYRKRRVAHGQVYGIYGKISEGKLRYESHTKEVKTKYKDRISKPEYHEGVRCARTLDGLALITHISSYTIRNLMRDGTITDQMWHKEGRTTYFHLDEIKKLFKKLKLKK